MFLYQQVFVSELPLLIGQKVGKEGKDILSYISEAPRFQITFTIEALIFYYNKMY